MRDGCLDACRWRASPEMKDGLEGGRGLLGSHLLSPQLRRGTDPHPPSALTGRARETLVASFGIPHEGRRDTLLRGHGKK